jgi:hypothetical protein
MINKRGILPLLIPVTVGMVLAFTLLVAVVFGGVALTTWILSVSVWRIAGFTLILLAGLSYLTGKFPIPKQIAMIMIIGGIVLVALPVLSDTFATPLSVIVP